MKASPVRARADSPSPDPDVAKRNIGLAVAARYLARTRALRVGLDSGVYIEIPVNSIQILAGATSRERSAIRIEEGGYALYWPLLDEGLAVPNLIAGSLGTRVWMRELARLGGSVTSPLKKAAAQANGRKGGRPSHRKSGQVSP
jgi:hypothetical protein